MHAYLHSHTFHSLLFQYREYDNIWKYTCAYMDGSLPTDSGPESLAPRRTARLRMWTILTAGASEPISPDFQDTIQFCFHLLTFHLFATSTIEYAGRTSMTALMSTMWWSERRGLGKQKRVMRRKELRPQSLRHIACRICFGRHGSCMRNKSKMNGSIAFASSPSFLCPHSRPILSGIPGTKHSSQCFRKPGQDESAGGIGGCSPLFEAQAAHAGRGG